MLYGTFPPSSAKITGYATEGALVTSSCLSTDAPSTLRKVWVLESYSEHRFPAPSLQTVPELVSNSAIIGYATGSLSRICLPTPPAPSNRFGYYHTPSIVFRYLPPDSAITGYAAGGAMVTSRICLINGCPKGLGTNWTAEVTYRRKHEAGPPRVYNRKKSRRRRKYSVLIRTILALFVLV